MLIVVGACVAIWTSAHSQRCACVELVQTCFTFKKHKNRDIVLWDRHVVISESNELGFFSINMYSKSRLVQRLIFSLWFPVQKSCIRGDFSLRMSKAFSYLFGKLISELVRVSPKSSELVCKLRVHENNPWCPLCTVNR